MQAYELCLKNRTFVHLEKQNIGDGDFSIWLHLHRSTNIRIDDDQEFAFQN